VGELHFIEGIMTAEVYLNILKGPLKRSIRKLFRDEDFIFQHDNDPKHTAEVIQDYLDDLPFEVLWWPAQSPDLNPIENLWSILDNLCRERKPSNKRELFEMLQSGWNDISTKILHNLCDSMPQRIAEVIERGGYHADY